MEQEILELYHTSGDPAQGKREASEWLDLKSRVEEDKFRKLSVDLERRRAWRFLYHAEEERKVVKELNNLQRDKLRFEREKQLRQRNSFSSSRERRHSLRTPLSEVNTQLPMNQKSFGGSASLAFDPTLKKSSRPSRRTSNEQTVSYGTVRKASEDLSASNSFPYLDEEDVQQFQKSCKSAAKSECRRWGTVWFYAKKEQDIANESEKRWTALLLKTEKEKMRILSEKGVALLEFGLERNPQSGNFGNDTRNTSKSARVENGVKMPDKKRKNSKETAMGYTEDERLTCHKAFSLPQAIAREQEEESSTDEVSQNKSRLSSVDCKHITSTLLEEGAQEKGYKTFKEESNSFTGRTN
ncbi:uncharacterized protein LOC110050807 [Orbicella faveolata]|uniref:uncharacterized protein LOC110050807 n=1 Tax=Orbicella faveolata TaxID=48498 RepID=UPI0009E30908|nr:uncharacterized protein LOC110050807 [Orbicella faveolata]